MLFSIAPPLAPAASGGLEGLGLVSLGHVINGNYRVGSLGSTGLL